MTDLYESISERLKPLVGNTSRDKINYVDLWNNQIQAINEKKQKAFRFNSIFIEFIVNQVKPMGYGIKDKLMTVRFYFAIKNLRSNKVQNLDFYEDFSTLIEGFASPNNTVPKFSAMHETLTEFDEDHDNIALPFVDYSTVYTDFSAYYFKNSPKLTPPITVVINKDIVDEIP